MKLIQITAALGVILVLALVIQTLTHRDAKRGHLKLIQAYTDTLRYYRMLDSGINALTGHDYHQARDNFRAARDLLSEPHNSSAVNTIAFIDHLNLMWDTIRTMDNHMNNLRSNAITSKSERDQLRSELNRSQKIRDTLESEHDLLMNAMRQLEIEQQRARDSLYNLSSSYGELNLVNLAGIGISYFGEIKNGKANGRGVGIYETGGTYKGNWYENMRSGFGFYRWANGDVYEGQFHNDRRNGIGTYRFKSGDVYVGSWANDLREGYGEYTSADGKISLKGLWSHDKFVKNNGELKAE